MLKYLLMNQLPDLIGSKKDQRPVMSVQGIGKLCLCRYQANFLQNTSQVVKINPKEVTWFAE